MCSPTPDRFAYMPHLWFVIALGFHSFACSQTQLTLLESAWNGLSDDERMAIQREHLISPIPASQVGVVIDNQGIDNSTPGSNGGSALGGAVASAAYVDNAFRPNHNYSAKGHLAAVLLGGILGSALNSAPTSEFHFRYAVRGASGEIRYFDSVSQSPFRHPVGVCLLLPSVTLSPDQGLCTQTPDYLREKYLKGHAKVTTSLAPASSPVSNRAEDGKSILNTQISGAKVLCKLAELPPIQTSEEKCKLINGEIIK